MEKEYKSDDIFQLYHSKIKDYYRQNSYTSIIRKFGGATFYTSRGVKTTELSLYLKKNEKLINIHNAYSEKLRLRYWSVSPNGSYVAYELVPSNSESGSVYVYDCTKFEIIARLPFSRHSQLIWTDDESQLLYIGAEAEENNSFVKRVYRYNTRQREFDGAILTIGSMKFYSSKFRQSPNNRHIYLVCTEFASNNMEIWCYSNSFTKIMGQTKSIPFFIDNKGIAFAVVKDELNPNGYIIQSKIAPTETVETIIKNAKVFIAGLPEMYSIESGAFSNEFLLIKGSWDGVSALFLYKSNGKFVSKLDLPDSCSVGTIVCDVNSEVFTFRLSFYHKSDEIWEYNCITNTYNKPLSQDSDFESIRLEVITRETTLSYVVVKKKNIKTFPASTIVTAYGAFGSIRRPNFIVPILPWLDRGNLYVVAHVRGGGERGPVWDKQGSRDNLENRLSDLMTITNDLVKRGYTTQNQLGLWGVSAGGWLMLATVLKYPQIVKSVCVFSAVTDMVTFHKYGFGENWKRDFGDPEDEMQRKYLQKLSPLHMTLPDSLPDVKIIFGTNDERVDPKRHSQLLYERLHAKFQQQVSCIQLDDVGHMIPANPSKIDFYARILAFFEKTLT